MRVEVDQSGKIEQMDKDSYIAFSNREQYCIKLPKKVKREILFECRGKVRQLVQRIFAICLYYCLENYLHNKSIIVIDGEYPGWDADIKTYLIPLLRLKHKNFDKIIRFESIGRDSGAHKTAKSTFIGKIRPNKILEKEDIMKWLK